MKSGAVGSPPKLGKRKTHFPNSKRRIDKEGRKESRKISARFLSAFLPSLSILPSSSFRSLRMAESHNFRAKSNDLFSPRHFQEKSRKFSTESIRQRQERQLFSSFRFSTGREPTTKLPIADKSNRRVDSFHFPTIRFRLFVYFVYSFISFNSFPRGCAKHETNSLPSIFVERIFFESSRLSVAARVDEYEPDSIWIQVRGNLGYGELLRQVVEGAEFQVFRLSRSLE